MYGNIRSEWPVCPGLTLAVPVVQAPLGAADGPRLAAEVSRAGGLGCLSLFEHAPASVARLLTRIRYRTRRPFLVALTAQWEPDAVLDACVAGGARHFQVFWWNGPRLARRIHEAEATVFWQVGTREQALDAARMGADVLVAQGTEAGGQVRGGVLLDDLIPEVREATGLPVVAGGGLATRADVAQVIALGAQAAMLGTRFVASEESRAQPAYKARLLRASTEHLYLDTRVIGSWPCAPHRRIRTSQGDEGPEFYAGLGVGSIRTILPAGRIVRSLDPGQGPK